jgi:ATP-dependent Clp protease ATP-binding subunit ClpC
MFERFTESAGRALFFARYETSQLGSVNIGTESSARRDATEPRIRGRHSDALGLFAGDTAAGNRGANGFREKVATSVEIPFSAETQRVLQHAAQEADNLGHSYIGVEHLLLGLLREKEAVAGSVLAAHGIRLAEARKIASQPGAHPDAPPETASTAVPLIDQIKELVQKLPGLAPGSTEARELTDRILRALDALGRMI